MICCLIQYRFFIGPTKQSPTKSTAKEATDSVVQNSGIDYYKSMPNEGSLNK